MTTTPFATSRLARFIDKRIGELHHKTQAEVAREAGFRNANFITMLKTGNAKLAIDRVPALAKALECDPSLMMRLAIEQTYGPEMLKVFTELLRETITDNEREWIELIRRASSYRDPVVTIFCQVNMPKILKI
ncbi:XRE family transcriptional regulator [Rhodobacter sp. Har01]|uniref:XRE family transcriptional regulator n=1 Tax=Rhodobacter sp. Har01 TaxID=2883999 RepID=UPI001D065F70|nr:XRE family transcriptional regulator [Rhodobacter sp. Har01]MCB6179023.1 XRE family transcriptional regulator [Rhodobacter sp. Har01]